MNRDAIRNLVPPHGFGLPAIMRCEGATRKSRPSLLGYGEAGLRLTRCLGFLKP